MELFGNKKENKSDIYEKSTQMWIKLKISSIIILAKTTKIDCRPIQAWMPLLFLNRGHGIFGASTHSHLIVQIDIQNVQALSSMWVIV